MTCSHCKRHIELTTTQITTGQVKCLNCKKSWQMTQLVDLQEKNLLEPPKTVQLLTQNGVPLLKIKGRQLKQKKGWPIVILLVIWLIYLFMNINSIYNKIWGFAAIFMLGLALIFVLRAMFFRCVFSIEKDTLKIIKIIGITKFKQKIRQSKIIQLTYKIEEESLQYRPHTQIVTSKKVYKVGLEMTAEASFYCYCWLKVGMK